MPSLHGVGFDNLINNRVLTKLPGMTLRELKTRHSQNLQSETVLIMQGGGSLERGAVIEDITRIERVEDLHFIFEDIDFSVATIKNLIKQGEEDAERALERKEKRKGKEK